MSRIKAILMDLDGTLVNSERKISPLTKNVLMKAQNMGIRLILASGRPISGMTSLAKELEMEKHHGMLICFNGSKVIDCETNEVLYNRTLTILEGKQVLEHMKKFNVKPMICKDNYMFVNNVFDGIINFNGDFNVIEYEAREEIFFFVKLMI